MGGISGHAGVFSTVRDMSQLAANLLAAVTESSEYEGHFLLNTSTVRLFSTLYNSSQSSRALGWDTNSYSVTDYGYSNSCGTLSEQTFMHIGYTGTCICIDPLNQVWSVVLTNRVYNCQGQSCTDPDSSTNTKAVYNKFNSILRDWTVQTLLPFQASYEWLPVEPNYYVHPGLEVRLPVGDRASKKEARIPDPFQLQLSIPAPNGLSWGPNSGKCRFFVRLDMHKTDLLSRIKEEASNSCRFLNSECIQIWATVTIGETKSGALEKGEMLDDTLTVEEANLFNRMVELRVSSERSDCIIY